MDSRDKRILAVFAHPDDETTTSGGTMARYAAEGAKVFVATVTRGEQGSLGSGEYEVVREDLPAVREAEMQSVLRALGTEPPIFLDYRDQEVSSADFEKLVTEVETVLELVKPDVVITWGPTGISSHDDHIAVHRATVEAFHRYRPTAAKEPVLYFVAITDEVAKMIESEGFEFEVHESERTPTVVIDIREHKSLKVRALRMYRSQQDAQDAADMFEGGPFDYEAFHRAYPAAPPGEVAAGFWEYARAPGPRSRRT